MKVKILFILFVCLCSCIKRQNEYIVDLPDGITKKSLKISDLEKLNNRLNFYEYEGYSFYYPMCGATKIIVLTKHHYFGSKSDKEIEKGKTSEVIGFHTSINYGLGDSTKVIECLTKNFNAEYKYLKNEWLLIKDNQVIGILSFIKSPEKYLLVLSRDKECIASFSNNF